MSPTKQQMPRVSFKLLAPLSSPLQWFLYFSVIRNHQDDYLKC